MPETTPAPPVFHPGDIVQMTAKNDDWFPVLLVVDSAHSWGVQAFAFVLPETVTTVGQSFRRLTAGTFVRVGAMVIMPSLMAKARAASIATAESLRAERAD